MHSPNTMSVPGAFNLSTKRDHGSAPRLSGAKSHIFQPPRSHTDSASSSLIMSRSTNSIVSMSTTTSTGRSYMAGSRKRSRAEAGNETPRATEEEWTTSMLNSGEANGAEVCPGSPTPFVSTKYVLQGGMDTPSMKAAQLALGEADYSDIGYRKSLDGDGMQHTRRGLFDMEGTSYFPADGLGRDANGRGRGWNSPRASGWSKAAIEVVGGVVGKVWEFCKHSSIVFRGFHAGGGNGYTVNSDSTSFHQVEQNDNIWETEKISTWGAPDLGTPLPGQFPDADFIPNYIDRVTPDAEARPAKRRQVSHNSTSEEINKNWVVVQPPSANTTPSKPQAPPRAPSRFSMPTASSANRRTTIAAPTRPASRAGFASTATTRRPMVPRVSHAGSPSLNSRQPASFASPRSSPSSKIPRASPMRGVASNPTAEHKAIDSPAAREAQRWAAMKKKEEREADESIRRLDRQLKAMIREGKEALGTKIEVEIDDDFELNRMPVSPSKKWSV
ncbi:hypothetical protein BGZ60DRAFT_415100 [Tricladium varicosporioides]|nr:hypothetical protein BGZ60DRAFT_415100 [Hymenoscyphus varicosporioides]